MTWTLLAITVSKIADEIKFYVDGNRVGDIETGLGNVGGTLHIDRANIGSWSSADGVDGYLSHGLIWTKALAEAQILDLSSV